MARQTTNQRPTRPQDDNLPSRINAAPYKGAKLEYRIENETESGRVSVTADTQLDALAAYSGLVSLQRAISCGICGSGNTKLTYREAQGNNGTYRQYVMLCQHKDCPGMLSFSVGRDDPNTLLESFNEQYREWYDPRTSGNNSGGNQRTSRGDSGSSDRDGGGRRGGAATNTRDRGSSPRQSRNNPPPQDDYDDVDDNDSDVPF